MDQIDSLTLIKFTFDVEKCFIHGLALADFIDEPTVFLVFTIFQKFAYIIQTYQKMLVKIKIKFTYLQGYSV